MKYRIFDSYAKDYDNWYERNKLVYLSELEALKRVVPEKGVGLEIGVGTGRFASPLGVKYGIDPSFKMAEFAKRRGVETVIGRGEKLPFKTGVFDFVLIVVTVCYFDEPLKAFLEAKRVLKEKGKIIVGFVDEESFLGQFYLEKKQSSIFYKDASFYSAFKVISMLTQAGFGNFNFYQTLFSLPSEIKDIEQPKKGIGEGGFVVISAESE
ncbi:conserved hypothetical protein [Thermotomaculum hydrothermale]|uniref:Methyltransferase type 11 domain-containing protein n=1 Tax=Thermotomaculum hydrothermale TaxID=981385 RepID=A0A7R6PN43_9BACT|nr:class I SAM-dependent methyltransferase [Thermotomaculum hydrothermale]BBB33127.1 conserved hypothetical protein [Thermotomaculum hydrothermale]